MLKLEPKNDTVQKQMVATQKLMRKIEFEKVRGATYIVSPGSYNWDYFIHRQ